MQTSFCQHTTAYLIKIMTPPSLLYFFSRLPAIIVLQNSNEHANNTSSNDQQRVKRHFHSTSLVDKIYNLSCGIGGYRLLWLGLILAVHGCAPASITVMSTMLAGPDLFLVMSAMVALGITLVSNLATMPSRVTIPAFILGKLLYIPIAGCAVFKR